MTTFGSRMQSNAFESVQDLLRRQLPRIIEHLQSRSTQSIWSAFQNLQPPRHQQGFDRG